MLANYITEQEKVVSLRERIAEVSIKPLLISNLKTRLHHCLRKINVEVDGNSASNHPETVSNLPAVIMRCNKCVEKTLNARCLCWGMMAGYAKRFTWINAKKGKSPNWSIKKLMQAVQAF